MRTHVWISGNNFRVGWVLALSLLLAAVPVVAQLSAGTILGVVQDSSGGMVPGATVTIQNMETSLTRTLTTASDGAYRVPALPVGRYTVRIEKEGFKTQTQQGLVLEVSQELVVNASLQVGTSAQEVVVTAEAPLVNTTTSALGGLVNEDKMTELPLNGRNYIDLSLMQAGITQAKNIGNGGGMSGTWYSSNGAPMRSNNFTLDGAPMINQLGGSTSSEAGTTLGVDGIREYRVITTTPSAEYGASMGSQMVIVSKSGSNRFSGDVFEFLRNSSLDARNYFDASPATTGRRLPFFQRNNFGAAFGGPIKKEKTFFFGVYEGLRQNLGVTAIDIVPHVGCFGAAGATINNTDCPELSNTTSVVIKPVTAPLLALYPQPNTGANGYGYGATAISNVNYGQMRVDQNFSVADSFFGRYTIDNSTLYNPATSISQSAVSTAFPQFAVNAVTRNQYLTLSENHIFSPALLNTVRFSFARTNYAIGNRYLANMIGPNYTLVPGFPIGTIAAGSGTTSFGPNTTYGPPDVYHTQNIYVFSDDLYYTRGKHAFKFGALINRFNQGMQMAVGGSGSLSYQDFAHFLASVPQSWSSTTPGTDLNRFFLYNTFGFYAQDDWRAASRLTVNLGLRWEDETEPAELRGIDYGFNDISVDTVPTRHRILRNYGLHNFSPRIGFAYDLTGNGKTAIRGGLGIYYDVGYMGAIMEQSLLGVPPITSRSTHTAAHTDLSGPNFCPYSTSTPNCDILSSLPLVYTAAEAGKTLWVTNYNSKQPYSIQYNLTIERQLPGAMGLTVSYVGLRGIHLFAVKEGNPIPATSFTNGLGTWDPTLPAYHRINTAWQTATYNTTAADSWYNGLQVVVNRRLDHGLQFQSSYTYGKSLDTAQGQMAGTDCSGSGGLNGVDPLNPKNDRGPSCFDAMHNWRFNLLYHLPNLKSNNFGAKMLRGWWVGNIVSVQSGYPFTPVLNTNRSQSAVNGSQADRVNVNTAASLAANPCSTSNPCAYTPIAFDPGTVITGNPNDWVNAAMFSMSPMLTDSLGGKTAGMLGTSSRDMLRGPNLRTWDFSVVKDTAFPVLGEKGSIQFRAEFFNFLNHTNFGMPSGTLFTGTKTHLTAYSEAPITNVTKINSLSTTSRQIQLSLKVLF